MKEKGTTEVIKNYYSCQKCQKTIETPEEVNIIEGKFPVCFECKQRMFLSQEKILYRFGEFTLIFDAQTIETFRGSFTIKDYKVIIHNGYLARTNGDKIEYFHRFILDDVLDILGKQLQVHHINGNKLDNRIINLQIIKKEEHYGMHKKEKYERAYNTWCNKVYGHLDEGEGKEEFDEWLAKKEEERW